MVYGSFDDVPGGHGKHGDGCDCNACEPRCEVCLVRLEAPVSDEFQTKCSDCLDAERQERIGAECSRVCLEFLMASNKFGGGLQ